MTFSIPEIIPPAEQISACITIPQEKLSDWEGLFPLERTALVAEINDMNGMSLLLETMQGGQGHFHLTVFSRKAFPQVAPNSTVETIGLELEKFKGRALNIKVESRFRVGAPLPHMGFLSFWANLGMNIGGITVGVAAATLRIQDSVFKEVQWKPFPMRGKVDYYIIEIVGVLDDYPVTDELLTVSYKRALDGYSRFVAPNPAFVQGKAMS